MRIAKFAWYDLLTTDTKAARAFYGELTGWKDARWCDGTYDLWMARDGAVAGTMALPAEARSAGVPPHWLGYTLVDDVDATAHRAARLGGSVLKAPADIPDAGRFAVLADPQGAAFAISTVASVSGDGAAPNHFAWAELHTTDWQTAWKFYAELFGWTSTGSFSMGPEWGTYFMFGDRPDQAFGAMFDGAKGEKERPHWMHYIRVADADAAARRTVELGGKILHGPADIPIGVGRVAQCLDPQGGRFGVVSGS